MNSAFLQNPIRMAVKDFKGICSMNNTGVKRSFWQRLFGICATPLPENLSCWRYEDGKVILTLSKTSELQEGMGAVRLEGNGLPKRILVVRNKQGDYQAFHNHCAHAGRRIDHDPATGQLQCCSVSKSTYSNTGEQISGPAKQSLQALEVTREDDTLSIQIL